MADKCHPQPSSSSSKQESGVIGEPHRTESTETRQVLEYCTYPETYCAREQSSLHAWKERGVRLSSLHYICLVLAIFSMGAVLTLWTAVALHGSQVKYEVFRSSTSPSYEDPRMAGYMRIPPIHLSPNFIFGAPSLPRPAIAETQHTSAIIQNEMPSSSAASSEPGSETPPTTSSEPSTSPTSPTATESVVKPQDAVATTTAWITTTVTPSVRLPKPSTRYFHPGPSPGAGFKLRA